MWISKYFIIYNIVISNKDIKLLLYFINILKYNKALRNKIFHKSKFKYLLQSA